MQLSRRGFLAGICAAIAAPAIIRLPGILMPVKNRNLIPYKGKDTFDAGIFYCPYIPLQRYDLTTHYTTTGTVTSIPPYNTNTWFITGNQSHVNNRTNDTFITYT
jgi:hypothetical protein